MASKSIVESRRQQSVTTTGVSRKVLGIRTAANIGVIQACPLNFNTPDKLVEYEVGVAGCMESGGGSLRARYGDFPSCIDATFGDGEALESETGNMLGGNTALLRWSDDGNS
ncbi:hypothetical protein BDW69DRAFT_182738 [Aspergillus filifer]